MSKKYENMKMCKKLKTYEKVEIFTINIILTFLNNGGNVKIYKCEPVGFFFFWSLFISVFLMSWHQSYFRFKTTKNDMNA